MFRAPGRTDGGVNTYALTETVDMFPTLVDLAMGGSVPRCPPDAAGVTTCTEGVSLAPLITAPTREVKQAALSVYNRGWQRLGDAALDEAAGSLGEMTFSMSTCLTGHGNGCTMGYSMMTREGGALYRFTEWVGFAGPSASFRPDWSHLVATELYNHTADPAENANIAARSPNVVTTLSARLRRLSDPQ